MGISSIYCATITNVLKRITFEVAKESDIRLKRDQFLSEEVKWLKSELISLKTKNAILEEQFTNFVLEEQHHESKQTRDFRKQIKKLIKTQFRALQAVRLSRSKVSKIHQMQKKE